LNQIPVIIIGHGELPDALLSSAQMLIGQRGNLHYLCLNEGDGLENFIQKVSDLVSGFEQKTPLLVFVDIQGGTPWNAVLGVNDARIRLVTGVNLPMLIEVLCLRDHCDDIDKIAKCAMDTAQMSVVYKQFPL